MARCFAWPAGGLCAEKAPEGLEASWAREGLVGCQGAGGSVAGWHAGLIGAHERAAETLEVHVCSMTQMSHVLCCCAVCRRAMLVTVGAYEQS